MSAVLVLIGAYVGLILLLTVGIEYADHVLGKPSDPYRWDMPFNMDEGEL